MKFNWRYSLRSLTMLLISITIMTSLPPSVIASPEPTPVLLPDDYIDPIPEGADKAPPLTKAEKEKLARFKEPTADEVSQTNFQAEFGYIDPSTLTDKFLAGLTETSSPVGI